VGASVTTADGTHLGWLDDLVIDPADAQITLVSVAVGGWFGLGGRFVVLPWCMLRPAAEEEPHIHITSILPREHSGADGADGANGMDQGRLGLAQSPVVFSSRRNWVGRFHILLSPFPT
jgi:hypothetical protein